MNWAEIARIAFQLSLAVFVFGSGLRARFADVPYVLKQPALLARSLAAVLVVMPVLAVLLVRFFGLSTEVAVALVALSISPLPPLLPQRGEKAGGSPRYALGLVLALALLATPVIVLAVTLLEKVFGRDYVATPWAITRLLVFAIVAPLMLGMTLARFAPGVAARLAPPLERLQRVLLPVAAVALLISAAPGMGALIGNHTLAAVTIFVVVGFGVGHLLGGPDPGCSAVLAFATSCRHPATAMALAAANYPTQNERGALALYALVTTVAGLLYAAWMRHRYRVPDAPRI